MIGFDTNVLLRAMLDDDPVQSPVARTFLSSLRSRGGGFVCSGVLLELYWVLERRYRLPKSVISSTMRQLSEIEDIEFEQLDAFAVALHKYESGSGDFSDILIAETARVQGCSVTYTFDRHAAKAVPGMELLA